MKVSDIHTHNPEATDAVINLEPGWKMREDALYSVGWHPWWPLPADMDWVEHTAADPRVALIGECGIDKLRGQGSIDEQIALTRRHAELSERLNKPLILHIVRAWEEIIALRKEMNPRRPWIIHGFRGKPQLARQLLAAGFDISLGPRYNEETLREIPPERLYRESD
ncbi:MAG: TatD family hydrolase [Bacteroides sp.]|nr:TatD family hydrolase [Bacteroides sp.]MCM1379003.1 TatD family hydrolase [Bacteroides sp.]MCM1445619.1 TatD family hydrolase [Prevotella sp.]